MRIGILGGTFNPPHIGHLILAEEARDRFRLDKVFFIPNYFPPHKDVPLAKAEDRLEMVKLSIKDNKNFVCLDIEIKRGGRSFTIDTVRQLRKRYPNEELFLILGSDLAKDFATWKDYRQLLGMVKVLVAKREGDVTGKNKLGFIFFDVVQVDVSSSLIRERIKEGLPIKYLVHPQVERFIKRRRLYR